MCRVKVGQLRPQFQAPRRLVWVQWAWEKKNVMHILPWYDWFLDGREWRPMLICVVELMVVFVRKEKRTDAENVSVNKGETM